MRKVVVFLTLILAFSSCTRDSELLFDEDRQLIVEGQITSSVDIDLSMIPINVTAFRSAGWFTGGGDFVVLGSGFLDASGNYRIVSTFPENADEINLEINSWRERVFIDSISQIYVNEIENLPFNNSRYSMPSFNLERLELFEIEVRKNSNTLDTLGFSITHNSSLQRFSIDREGNLFEFDGGSSVGSRIDPDDAPNIYKMDIIENSDIFIHYSIRNKGLLEQGEFIVPTDGQESRFVFEY
ncbi:hypothetical protein [Croceitalea rosinachiae]|uniref:Uncharacterized protein n=1 Tax=Croceitalea rosinachiae TaxID=3075596 RepID=A0ABU3A7N6_9FLAO|nr:hypothetical protein [Croceitalea sp. F388]MDT0606191.1 hypothetical protein [Croceitalea sp. F388]